MLVALRVKIDFECQIILKRFGREMDGDNINAPLLSHEGLVWLSACLRDALGRHQASRRHGSGIRNPLGCDHSDPSPDGTFSAMVSLGSMVFSSLNTASAFLSENKSPI